MSNIFIDGNEACGAGAIAAGCNFFAGYPITPATSIYNYMLNALPSEGGVCLQGEDEIASIGYCIGASMTGKKTMTATSGPGISLYSENISFAIGSEIPLVIVDVQRLGPSTGSATKGADGDVNFIRYCNTGGIPVYALAPADVRDCYLLTINAFNIAEKLRCPVFILSNKEIALTKKSVNLNSVKLPQILDRVLCTPNDHFLPFATDYDDTAPPFLPIGSETLVRQTSSTHGINGYITIDSKEIFDINVRLQKKVENSLDEFLFYDELLKPDSDTLIITYGISSSSAIEASHMAEKTESNISVLTLKTLWPVCEDLIREKAQDFKNILVIEMNQGQYVNEIKRVLPEKNVQFLGRMNGTLIKPSEILEVLTNENSYK
ncbi:MAG: pyruvate flavodoxin/ferredoxin oxidoreductase [Desulfobacteraceae bacterium]|nr:pyruvate flavodoxin/ferredoxin oxidoreductase [Desulfobacteraceae bacterium]